ncbi:MULTISPECIES: hypothetical protein [unclassified Kribbella]|uniref:hypothetical protein n=1 Tax=unclassified Kribbella TaxID=2644121 RepID=UPI0033CCA844
MSNQVTASPDTAEHRTTMTGSKLWLLLMVGLWMAFYLFLGADRLDDVETWIRDLPLVLELGVWLVGFPWVLATAVWTSDLSETVRVTLVVLFTVVWTIISIPRPKRAKQNGKCDA